MQKRQNDTKKEIMSMEEYIRRRQKAKEEERMNGYCKEEKSPAWMFTELYG